MGDLDDILNEIEKTEEKEIVQEQSKEIINKQEAKAFSRGIRNGDYFSR